MAAKLAPLIEVEKLSFEYRGVLTRRGTRALQEVSVQIYPGDCFGIVGPNGAGKTTLVRLLAGLLPLQSGFIRIWGSSNLGADQKRKIGYVPEKIALYEFLTGGELLDFHARLLGLPERVRRSRIQSLLEELDLASQAGKRIRAYSKGMHQRLSVAQALLGEPDLLILDEPTDGLDPVGRHEVLKLLHELNRKGKTILINSHQLREVESLCNRFVLLEAGRVLAHGSLQDLVRSIQWLEIDLRPMQESVIQQLLSLFGERMLLEGHKARLTLQTEEEVNAVVHALHNLGVPIHSTSTKSRTLEEFFLQALGKSH